MTDARVDPAQRVGEGHIFEPPPGRQTAGRNIAGRRDGKACADERRMTRLRIFGQRVDGCFDVGEHAAIGEFACVEQTNGSQQLLLIAFRNGHMTRHGIASAHFVGDQKQPEFRRAAYRSRSRR